MKISTVLCGAFAAVGNNEPYFRYFPDRIADLVGWPDAGHARACEKSTLPKLTIDPEKIDLRNIPLDEPGARSVLVTNSSEPENAEILTISAEPNPPFDVEQSTNTCTRPLPP